MISQDILPRNSNFSVIFNEDLKELNLKEDDSSYKKMRENELKKLTHKINNLPKNTFNEMRESEIDRLSLYYDSFAEIYNIDLRAVATTRMQISGSIMNSSIVLLQSIFNDTKSEQTGLTFFNSRRKGGGFDFNANGETHIEGYSLIFSVLKRKCKDKDGMFEVDYPAYSVQREVISLLYSWHNSEYTGQDINSNPLIKTGLELMSRRVHDWIHAAVLYDSQSLTSVFQKWSDNSFFVKHFFSDPGMINYELLSAHLHFSVWQQIFTNKTLKERVIYEAQQYLQMIDNLFNWSIKFNPDFKRDEVSKICNFLSYIGLRGLFDILPYNDKELQNEFKENERFQRAFNYMPETSKAFLDEIYKPNKMIPFRVGSNAKLTVDNILDEYVTGLKEEASTHRRKSMINSLIVTNFSNRGYLNLFTSLPIQLKDQLAELDIYQFDPRVFTNLLVSLKDVQYKYGKQFKDLLENLIEIDTNGYFYIKINRDEIELTNKKENDGKGMINVIQRKKAILVQIPYEDTHEYHITLKRVSNLLNQQNQDNPVAKSGDVIIVNTQNETVAKKLLKQSTENNHISIEKFIKNISSEASKGLIELNDSYVYELEKAITTFGLEDKKAVKIIEGKKIIVSGYYETMGNLRRAFSTPGPISIDSNINPTLRRRILSGAIVENHVQTGSEVDIFPVHSKNFTQFYRPALISDLNDFTINSNFLIKHGLLKVKLDKLDNVKTFEKIKGETTSVIHNFMSSLNDINNIIIHGYRGKPEVVKFKDLTSYYKSK